jgi:hypothetical protein
MMIFKRKCTEILMSGKIIPPIIQLLLPVLSLVFPYLTIHPTKNNSNFNTSAVTRMDILI